MQTIRKSLYIGLGGTGVKAVAETKKMFEDSFGVGNIPPHVTFLALDFDRNVIDDRSLATDISSDFVQLPLSVNPFLIHHAQRGKYDWMPEQNALFIPEFMECGAGQVRSNSRLFADLVMPCIEAAVNSAMAHVLAISNVPKGYVVMNDDYVNVYLAMSLAGGTGSALMFVIAQMIREQYDHAHLIGYGVMHSIFQYMDPYGMVTPRVKTNVYASLQELDYFQSATCESKVVHSILGKRVEKDSPLFDEFYVVDNKTQLGGVVDSITSLCNAIGCSMYYGATDVGKSHSIDWRKRGLNWGAKTSWVHAFGVCQIVYDGPQMEYIYRANAALAILNRIKGENKCDRKCVADWAERVNLREDGDEYNKLIDWICPSDTISRIKSPNLDVSYSADEIKSRISKYIDKNTSLWTKDHVSKIQSGSTSSLHDEIRKMMTDEGGIVTSISFLDILEEMLIGYKGEMENEARNFRTTYDTLGRTLDTQLKDYDHHYHSTIGKLTGKHRRCLESISVTSVKRTKAVVEVERREAAVAIFTSLVNEVRSLKSSVKRVESMVQEIEKSYRTLLHKRELEQQSVSIFEINLSLKDAEMATVNMNDNILPEFIKYLPKPLVEMEMGELELILEKYTYSLPAAAKFRDCQIMDIIENMSDEEYEELKHNILRKSAPLLSLHDRGLLKSEGNSTPISNMMKVFYISAYKEDDDNVTRFEGDSKLLAGDNVRVSFVPSDSESMKQRIFIHRVDSAIMPYCIESFSQLPEFILPNYNPYLGRDTYERIAARGFSMKPEI